MASQLRWLLQRLTLLASAGDATGITFVVTKHVFVVTKHVFCCDKSMLAATKDVFCRNKLVTCLSWQNVCHDKKYTCGSSYWRYTFQASWQTCQQQHWMDSPGRGGQVMLHDWQAKWRQAGRMHSSSPVWCSCSQNTQFTCICVYCLFAVTVSSVILFVRIALI